MAAAGPKAELERDRVRFRERDSGVAGWGEVPPFSPTGVEGIEFSLDRDPLRDLGRSSWGC
jgi:L-alanine-DL-glutamate epimerase-like enolase superfamily enzyme